MIENRPVDELVRSFHVSNANGRTLKFLSLGLSPTTLHAISRVLSSPSLVKALLELVRLFLLS